MKAKIDTIEILILGIAVGFLTGCWLLAMTVIA